MAELGDAQVQLVYAPEPKRKAKHLIRNFLPTLPSPSPLIPLPGRGGEGGACFEFRAEVAIQAAEVPNDPAKKCEGSDRSG